MNEFLAFEPNYYIFLFFQMRLTIFRPDVEHVEKLEVDLIKKSGKQFGIGLRVHHPKGMILTDVVNLIIFRNLTLNFVSGDWCISFVFPLK